MPPAKKRRRSRAFFYSFVGTFLILFLVVIGGVLFQPSYQRGNIPSPPPTYSAVWGRYVPAGALSMAFENFTKISAADPTLPPSTTVLTLGSPQAVIGTADLRYHLVISYETPNETVDVLFLKAAPYSSLASAFSQEAIAYTDHDGYRVYEVGAIESQGATIGWASLVPADGALIFTEGDLAARTALQDSLDVIHGNLSSMISREDVRQMLYTVGGAEGHYSIGIQNFPGAVITGSMTLVAVDNSTGYVSLSNVVLFPDPSIATSQFSAVKSTYIGARQFQIYGPCVKAVELDPPTSLFADYRLVG